MKAKSTGRPQMLKTSVAGHVAGVPVYGIYDVVVAGGGPAGVVAAVSAARNGAKVLLIEQTGGLGGMGTSGLVPCFCPYSNSDEPLIRGIGYEILERLRKKEGVGDRRNTIHWVTIDAEKLKCVYDEMVAKCKVLLFTFVSDVIRCGDRIKAVVIENKSGRQAVLGKVFVDCTGDADLAFKSKVRFEKGGSSGELQGVTLCFVLAGVNTAAFRKWFKGNRHMTDFLHAAEAKGELKAFRGADYVMSSAHVIYPGVLGLNFGHIYGIDGTNAEDITRAMIKGRALAHEFLRYARARITGFKQAEIVTTGTLPGVRETRRIEGEYRLTVEDFKAARHFEDDIAVYAYPVDVHSAAKSSKDRAKTLKALETLVLPSGKSYGIPYRCLLPKGVGNLIVAGRSISADRMMQGSIRVMPSCFAMGQAAGTAAAMAVKENIFPKQINIKRLQKRLSAQGAKIG